MCKHYFENPGKTISKDIKKIEANPLPAIGTVLGDVVGGPIGAAVGNFAGNVASGNKIGSSLLSAGETYGGAELMAVGEEQLGYGSGSTLSSDYNSLTSGISDLVNQGENFLGLNTQEAGGALGTATDSATSGITSSTGSGVAAAPSISGAVSGGGFTPASSLLSNTPSPDISTALDNTASSSTNLGSLSGSGSNFSGINTIGSDLSTPTNGGIIPPSEVVQTGSTGGGGGGLEAGTALPSSSASGGIIPPSEVVPTSSAAVDSLGVPGGVAPPLPSSSGASSVSSTFSPASSVGDYASQLGSALTNPSNLKYALPAGELINTLISGPQKLPSAAQALAPGGAVEGPLQQTEQMNLNAYNTQTLTPGQQAQVDQYIQQAQNALYQQLASSGVQNPNQDSRFIQGMQNIQQQAESMKSQLLGTDLSAGMSAGGAAAQDLGAVAQMQNQSDAEYQQAIESAISSFASMQGGSSIEKFLGA